MVKWTPKSHQDLLQIREFIAKNFNIDLAIETIVDLVTQVESILSQNPLAGMILESNPLFSKLIHKGNIVYYCENPRDKNLYIVYVQARGSNLNKNRISSEEVA